MGVTFKYKATGMEVYINAALAQNLERLKVGSIVNKTEKPAKKESKPAKIAAKSKK